MNRLYQLDLNLCIQFNRLSAYQFVVLFFRFISRLGNGVFWYSLMLTLPLVYGPAGWLATTHMITAALPALLIYRYLKKTTSRPRPCAVHPCVRQVSASLDTFSFPSGHTLHAVGFTCIVSNHLPALLWILLPFAVLVALSRPILGLHYPSDVLAGATIGLGAAATTGLLPVFS